MSNGTGARGPDGGRVPGWLATGAAWSWRLLLLLTASTLILMVMVRLYLVTLPVIIALFLLVRAYYRRCFGDVRPLWTSQRIFMRTMLPVLVGLGYLAAIIVTNSFGVTGPWLFAALLIVFCLMMIGSSWRARAHYLVSAALLAAFILVPLGALPPSGVHPVEWEYPNMIVLLMGAVFVVNGLIDHRRLVRTLPPVTDTATENGTA
jgi:hypothetical protein